MLVPPHCNERYTNCLSMYTQRRGRRRSNENKGSVVPDFQFFFSKIITKIIFCLVVKCYGWLPSSIGVYNGSWPPKFDCGLKFFFKKSRLFYNGIPRGKGVYILMAPQNWLLSTLLPLSFTVGSRRL